MLEVLLAVTVGGVVLTLAVQLLWLADRTAKIASRTAFEVARAENSVRWLRESLSNVLAGLDSGLPLEGDIASLSFATDASVPEGWDERRVVTLSLTDRRLIAHLKPTGDSVVLANRIDAIELAYLDSPDFANPGVWRHQWRSQVALPRAVRLVIQRRGVGAGFESDTTFYPLGIR